MKKRSVQAFTGLLLLLGLTSSAAAHCEIPCGIYDDELRVGMLLENITTIEKSMNQITELGKSTPVNYNQLVRWVENKEHHAGLIQEVVAQYFMTQRIKPDTGEYCRTISVLHQMLIYSMRCKQSTDLTNTAKLRELVEEFKLLYFPRK